MRVRGAWSPRPMKCCRYPLHFVLKHQKSVKTGPGGWPQKSVHLQSFAIRQFIIYILQTRYDRPTPRANYVSLPDAPVITVKTPGTYTFHILIGNHHENRTRYETYIQKHRPCIDIENFVSRKYQQHISSRML